MLGGLEYNVFQWGKKTAAVSLGLFFASNVVKIRRTDSFQLIAKGDVTAWEFSFFWGKKQAKKNDQDEGEGSENLLDELENLGKGSGSSDDDEDDGDDNTFIKTNAHGGPIKIAAISKKVDHYTVAVLDGYDKIFVLSCVVAIHNAFQAKGIWW